MQVWVSFLLALLLCAVGLAWLPGGGLERAFMVMGYAFCLSAVFVLAKCVRDRQQARRGQRPDAPLFALVVWGGFALAMGLTACGLLRMEISPSRERAQAWLRLRGYEPTTLHLGPLTRLGGRLSAANVAFDDQPDARRFSDRIDTVTVDSVFAWMERAGLGGAPVRLQDANP